MEKEKKSKKNRKKKMETKKINESDLWKLIKEKKDIKTNIRTTETNIRTTTDTLKDDQIQTRLNERLAIYIKTVEKWLYSYQ